MSLALEVKLSNSKYCIMKRDLNNLTTMEVLVYICQTYNSQFIQIILAGYLVNA